MINDAVVLAAGKGSRLGPLTATTPKPLLDVAGRPTILHVLDALAGAGITRVTVVTGHLGDHLEASLRAWRSPCCSLRFVRQETLDGTARALALAEDTLDGSFLFCWGDILVGPATYADVLAAAGSSAGVLAVNEVADPSAGAAVYVDDTMRIQRVVEKPARGTSVTNWNNAGIGVLPPAIWAAIDALEPSERGEYELPRAIASLIERGHDFRAVPVRGQWFDIGTPETLAAAREAFAGGMP